MILCLLSANLVWAAPEAIMETEEISETGSVTEEEPEAEAEPEAAESETTQEDISDDIEPQEDEELSLPEEEEMETEAEPDILLQQEEEKISREFPEKGQAPARAAAGWEEAENGIRYRNGNGGYLTDTTKKIGKYTFMFDAQGYVKTGWQEISGRTYYLKKTGEPGIKGAMLLGWQNVNGKTYYFKRSGAKAGVMLTGLQSIGGRKFYFAPAGGDGEKGRMVTGWQEVNGRTYYLKKTGEKGVKGKALIGWQSIGGKPYYFLKSGSQSGKMLTGFQSIGGRKFYFKKTGEYGVKGRMLLGWQSIGGNKYYFKQTGANGLKGAMFVGWQTINKKQYYFDPNGVYIPGKKKITVAVDAGHQLKGNSSLEPIGPGASEQKPKVSSGTYGQWSGLNEYELNLTVARKLQTELENRGYNVYMIRTTHNVNISNSQRAKNAADAGADILIRIHANSDSSSSVSGALTIAPTSSNPYMTKTNISQSRLLSQKVLDAFCRATGAKKRSIWYTDTMSGINWSTIPVTIVEMGFMSNRQDDLNMANASYQNKMVKGMADGIDDYFR